MTTLAPPSGSGIGPEAARHERAGRVGALDGLRAVAVLAVLVYHLWPRVLPSGFLGVDVFMVLSGFLITGLLASEHARTGGIRLGAFWLRRFRRLVPAVMLLLVAVAAWVALIDARALAPSVRAQGLAALVYLTNWQLVADGTSYGGEVAGESPLVHLWSLAVEEQFYVVWPVLVVLALAWGRGRAHTVVAVAAVGALASTALMWALYDPARDPLRIYYGTDTRAQAFLVGAIAALVAPRMSAAARRFAAAAGGLALVAVLAVMLTDAPDRLYRGGFGLVAVGTACVVVAATVPGPVSAVLDRAPLRVLGRVSYAVYLWHWPAIVLLTPDRTGLGGVGLLATRLGVTAAGAAVSWVAVERPFARWSVRPVAFTGVVAMVGAAAALAALPGTPVVAFAGYRTDRVPDPVVLAPGTVAETPPDAAVADDTGEADGQEPPGTVRTSSLALPAHGTAMIVGDSGMFSAAPALNAALQASGWRVVDTAYPGMGLTSPADARDRWADAARRYEVDLTVVMIGGWDVDWVARHGEDAYRAVIDASVAAFTSGGGKVLWLSVLPGGGDDDRELEHLFAELPERHRGIVDYLDVEAALRDPGGGWPEVVAGVRLRGPDGWHLCPEGAAAVAGYALGYVGLDRGDWLGGAWREAPRYEDPAGACAGL